VGLLDGKKALIAGVANKQSIAWGIAQALQAHGAQLAITCLESNLRRVEKLAGGINCQAIFPCDVRNDRDIKRACDQVASAFGGELDILVHAIAFANLDDLEGEFIKVSRSGWQLALDVSGYSLVAFARCARPLMNEVEGGTIITLTYGDGLVHPGYNMMGVAKAALDVTVRYLAYDLGPENIRVNAIYSGPIKTTSSLLVENFDVAMDKMEECSPLLRNVTVDDVSKTAVYLASDLSSGVTGGLIKVDAGMTTMSPATVSHRRLQHIEEV
jgi:enoyl-[acyl-carrier protein] reductase I